MSGEFDGRGMKICMRCFYLYDTKPSLPRQLCHCHGRGEDRWPGYDYNEHTHLCECCAAETLPSGSRWSIWFCDDCKERVVSLNRRVGFALVPIGRHSVMNGVFIKGGKESAQSAKIDDFVKGMTSLFGRMDNLHEWRNLRINANLIRLGQPWEDDIDLDEYLRLLQASDDPAVSKSSAYEGLCDFFEVPRDLWFDDPAPS